MSATIWNPNNVVSPLTPQLDILFFGIKNIRLPQYAGGATADDGVTNEGACLRAAIAEAATEGGGVIWIPPNDTGYVFDMAEIHDDRIYIHGAGTRIIQTVDASCVQVGGTDYTMSPWVIFQRGVNYGGVEGFIITQDATFNALAATYTSTANFAPVIVHRANYIKIANNVFNCYMGRGIQIRGGNFNRIEGTNQFIACGLTNAVGFTSDSYYGDPVGVAVPFYSSVGTYVGPITILGSSIKTQAANSLHMTGCNDFVVDKPNILNLTDPLQDGIRIYASDFGVSDINGNVVTKMKGIVNCPQVTGTCGSGVSVIGDSAGGVDVITEVDVTGAHVRVTGLGIKLERFVQGKISGCHIVASASPLWMGDSLENCSINDNYFESTVAGTSLRTLFVGSTTEMLGFRFFNNFVTSSPLDDYILETTSALFGPENAFICNNTFTFKSSSITSRVIELAGCTGALNFNDNIIDIRAAGISNRFIASITERAGTVLSINAANNAVGTSNSTVYIKRGIVINASDDVMLSNNDVGGMDITCTSDVVITGGQILHDAIGSMPLKITGASEIKVSNVRAEQATAGNNIVMQLNSFVRAKVSNVVVAANASNQPVIQANTFGVLEVDSVTVINTGTGAPYAVTGVALLYGNLGSNQKDLTPWSDANRLAATMCAPGTVFWNSSDSFPNYSNQVNWLTPAGIPT